MGKRKFFIFIILLGLMEGGRGGALALSPLATDLTSLPFEELLNIEVTSVSKKTEKFYQAPAAIYVITPEDLRRSGVTSIQEALRMVPGVEVGRVNANQWAISARGFNSLSANKLLVLIDGRSVYTPLFAGIYWSAQDMVLEDIERIEVIRGPGASLWGVNAVNGVINIITKNAQETQGILSSTIIGDEERFIQSLRYGGKFKDRISYRVYAKYLNRDEMKALDGGGDHSDWEAARTGFRMDWGNNSNIFKLSGDIYEEESGISHSYLTLAPLSPVKMIEDIQWKGGNIIFNWDKKFNSLSKFSLQAYYDYFQRTYTEYNEYRNTFDFELKHQLTFKRHDIVWGGGCRFFHEHLGGSNSIHFAIDSEDENVINGFFHDEITVLDNLKLIVGSKFEHNKYSNWAIQPNIRLAFTPSSSLFLWAAVSRAKRLPARIDREGTLISLIRDPMITSLLDTENVLFTVRSNKELTSEAVTAYEAGLRFKPRYNLFFDMAFFYNRYSNLLEFKYKDLVCGLAESPPDPIYLCEGEYPDFIFEWSNLGYGSSTGVEFYLQWQPFKKWLIKAAYTYINVSLHSNNNFSITTFINSHSSPHHRFTISSYLNITDNIELDTSVRYIDNINIFPDTHSYIALDARVGWHPAQNLEVSLVIQNLLHDEEQEFVSFLGESPAVVESGLYGKLTWRY